MKAAVVHAHGKPPRYEDFPDPRPAPGEALVHVAATGLHPLVKARAADRSYTAHGQLPLVPGVDGVGRLADGSLVYFVLPRAPYGTFSELTVVRQAACFAVPDGLDAPTAAAVMNPGLSGWLALTARAGLATGASVLVWGATGAAGKLAIQAARLLGAGHVTAAGRDRAALASLTELGADATVDLDPEQLPREHYDIVLDYLWGPPALALLTRLAQPGRDTRIRYIQIGESAGATTALPADLLRSSGLELLGSGAGSVPTPQIRHAIPEYLRHAAAGDVHIDTETVALADVPAAWHRPQRGRRLVAVPQDS